MARSPNEKAEKARELYKGGMKLVEIASQLDVPPGTVRRWKSTYHWDGEHQLGRTAISGMPMKMKRFKTKMKRNETFQRKVNQRNQVR